MEIKEIFKKHKIVLSEEQERRFLKYYDFLVSENQKYNLTAITSKEEVFYKHFLDSVFTNVKTRITDYGINNALLEIYLQVTIYYEIILPVTAHKETLEYELLIDAGLIQGKVPNWYANSFETQSAFLELPFA